MDPQLSALARARGVATWYENADRQRVEVAEDVVRAVLDEMGPPTPSTTQVVTEGPDTPPIGYHQLDDGQELIVTPRRLPAVTPAWGWMLQLYALHSKDSWGIGDYADLREFTRLSGAGVVLVNPVQAITPALPVRRSPYSPSSRRFANPVYLRVTETDEFTRVDAATREAVLALAPPSTDLIDYDAVWTAKLAALELLWPGVHEPMPDDLRDFATFCAIAERHGGDWREWPTPLRRPDTAAVVHTELADRIAFHAWLQRLCEQQLTDLRARTDARIVHDLPVGVDPSGADAWALQDVLAPRVRVGAPPDAFSQLGQDWNLPPWRPDRLAATGYRPFRDVIRSVLRHADGIRVDHIAGLFRLWWIPPGRPANEGTYVYYDADAMLGILALEAHLAGAMVVGEDLGTVPEAVTDAMHARGVLSSSVLYFERDYDAPGQPLLAPKDWPVEAMASISTHDLPTTAGFLRGENVRVRAELGLVVDADGEYARAAEARDEMLVALSEHGLLPPNPSDDELVVALHRLLATSASRLLLTSPQDAVGELRQPNLPGTVDEYPNWRIPLPVSVEELLADPRVQAATAALREARPSGYHTVDGPVGGSA
ncbi:4-alpha-glucanotransferase [Actinophytocola oryzae]|uniref:4-alpha-glucanotransferase n=1 Tax=Actinophytocola oryzae TaxID=502181 RepID=A0A4R7VUN2_9PSEU|nr:4-alpha-glucanotransferase [Actinophytocola oryzae]TDV53676.1 4-alpha-glucanotransferase [Actinophytocola oryzae]